MGGFGAAAGMLLLLAEPAAAATGNAAPPRPLVGDIVIFNDEIIEPVSLPVSLCGTTVAGNKARPRCGETTVSDDDA
ncbi:hypothetical protein AB0K60_31275 [Thermopolyspora sp. NPDC052614]|uniref:hypothetical protein n=1 Tax=Thermopolyspora sp. NPDC052614 TaxID=3155682 RepID=UPI00342F6DAE